MDNLKSNNKFLLFLILLLAFALRYFCVDWANVPFFQEYVFEALPKGNVDFFEIIRSNTYAPLHCFYMKFWMATFRNSDFLLKLSLILPDVLGCFVLYFCAKNLFGKDNDNAKPAGLVCALYGAVSSYLIYSVQFEKTSSLVFFLTSLILFYSVNLFQNCDSKKKNKICIFIFSLALVLEHTIGFIFVLFNIFGLLAFKNSLSLSNAKGKSKAKAPVSQDGYLIPLISMLILTLPLVPYILKMFFHPSWTSKWWQPFNWSDFYYLLSGFFSPVLRGFTDCYGSSCTFLNQIINNGILNFGFILFALIPTLLGIILLTMSIIDTKKINKYILAVFFAGFLAVLTALNMRNIPFLIKYFVEFFAPLILLIAVGLMNINSKNLRIIFFTVYVFMNLFFIIAYGIFNLKLL